MQRNGSRERTPEDIYANSLIRGLTNYQISVLIAVFSILIIYGYRVITRHKQYTVQEEVIEENFQRYKLFTAEELAHYDGSEGSKGMYLSIMGDIFDVSKGKQHYMPGSTYHVFVGRDASRAFVTGEFDGKKDQLDHVLSLTPQDLVSLKNWRDFYEKDYIYVGKLIGRYYDENGEKTEYYWAIERKIQFGLKLKQEEDFFKNDFPPCNVEWQADVGTRVWCTKQSGGIEREWAGYPMQYFNQESKDYVCVCVKKELIDLPQLRAYDNCNDLKRECLVNYLD